MLIFRTRKYVSCLKLNAALLVPVLLAVASGVWAGPDLKVYEGKYHTIHTDLPRKDAIEAVARVNAMAEQYFRRTKDFDGKITEKFPFYLYSRYSDYQKSLPMSMPGSVGVYTGKDLRATADASKVPRDQLWRVVQHEGFHQFVHKVITNNKNNLPIWLNEGMAEYFGEARWTGSDLVTGVVDGGQTWVKGNRKYTRISRLQRVQKAIKEKKFRSLLDLLKMSHKEWNSELTGENYDQAWATVQFLVHAQSESGRYLYRKRFTRYLEDMVKDRDSVQSFKKRLGSVSRMQKLFESYWLSRKRNPSLDVWDKVTIERLMNFMARHKIINHKYFSNADTFFKAARAGKIKFSLRDRDLWLPQSLLDEALEEAGRHPDWDWKIKIDMRVRPTLVLTRPDGVIFECSYIPKGKKPPKVKTRITYPKD